MASEFTLPARSPYLRGLILHDERINVSNIESTLSSYTEEGEEPSQPTQTTSAGYMTLEAAGTSPAGGQSLMIATQKEGPPVGSDAGGRFRWKKEADSSSEWRGHLPPNKMSGFELVRFIAAGAGYAVPDAANSGDDVVCVYKNVLGGTVACSTLSAETDAWTHTVVTPDGAFAPSIVAIPKSGGGTRLLATYLRTDLIESGTTYWTLGMSFSDDAGATWTLAGKHLPGLKVSYGTWAPELIRCAYHGGYLTLLISPPPGAGATKYHLVSSDLGSSWTQVETITSNAGFYTTYADALGTIRIVFRSGTSELFLHWGKKASPYSKFADDPDYDTALTFEQVNQAHDLVVDDAGYLWVYASAGIAEDAIRASRFNAQTMQLAADEWMRSSLGSNVIANPWYDGGATGANHPDTMCVVGFKGRVLLICNAETHTSTADNSLFAWQFGGFSTLDWQHQTFGVSSSSIPLGVGYVPIDLPVASVWTSTGAGTPALSADGLTITTSANDLHFHRDGSTSGNPVIVWATVHATTGGTLGNDNIALKVHRADGSVHYNVSLRINLNAGAQEFRLYDNIATAAVGSDATGLPDEPLDVLVAMGTNRAAAYYKRPTGTKWTLIAAGTISDGGAGTAANRLDWGHIIAGTTGSTWRMVNSAMDGEAAATALSDFTNPTDLQGCAFSTSPGWVNSGTRISGTGGPTFRGDAWSAVSRAQFGVQNVCPDIASSPSVMWRSTNTSEASIAWQLSAGTMTRFLSSSIGVALCRPNFRQAIWEGYNGVGWTTIITFDGAQSIAATTLSYQITGNHVQCAPASVVGDRWFEGNELVGGYVELDWSGSGGGTLVAEIVQHSSGVWRDPALQRGVEFIVRSDSLASINTPTTCRFIPPLLVGVRHNVTANFSAYRLRIPAAQATKEGYYQLGAVVAGPLAVLGMANSWGRTQALEAQQEIVTTSSGSRMVRKIGPPRRRVELSWSDGWPTNEIYKASPDPTYLVARAGSSYEGIGVRDDATLLRSVLRRQDGALRPVVYLPKIDQATGATMAFQYSSPARALYGRIVSPAVTSQSLVGDEAQSEVVSIDAVVIEEET